MINFEDIYNPNEPGDIQQVAFQDDFFDINNAFDQNEIEEIQQEININDSEEALQVIENRLRQKYPFSSDNPNLKQWKEFAYEYIKNNKGEATGKGVIAFAVISYKCFRAYKSISTAAKISNLAIQALSSDQSLKVSQAILEASKNVKIGGNMLNTCEKIVQQVTENSSQASKDIALVTTKQIINATALETTKYSFKESAKMGVQVGTKSFKSGWPLALGNFLVECVYHTYQFNKSSSEMSWDCFQHKIKTAAYSNSAGFVGSSVGAGIGAAIGSFFSPGIGVWIGSILGGFVGGIGSSLTTEYLMQRSYDLVKKEQEVTLSYAAACQELEVRQEATKQTIQKKANAAFLANHPDKYQDPQDQEFYSTIFIKKRVAYEFIKNYRIEKGTWE